MPLSVSMAIPVSMSRSRSTSYAKTDVSDEIDVYVEIHSFAKTYVHVCNDVHSKVQVTVYVDVCEWVSVHVCVCVCVRMSMTMNMYVYVY